MSLKSGLTVDRGGTRSGKWGRCWVGEIPRGLGGLMEGRGDAVSRCLSTLSTWVAPFSPRIQG
jgi:hypothetical protein